MTAMPMPPDGRAVTDYRIAARDLRPGDLVNTSPGADDDWQEVLAVHQPGGDALADTDMARLVEQIGDRYVVVELTDLAPVDSNVYFSGGTAMLYASDGGPDPEVDEAISEPGGVRTYLYTVHELVTIRTSPAVRPSADGRG
jgi:hypothetical protein